MTLDPTAETQHHYAPSRADRIGITIFMGAGLAIIVWSIVAAVMRIIDVLSHRTVQVLAEFAGTPAHAPIGVDGALVDIELDRAILSTAELPTFSLVALVIQQVAVASAITVVVA